MSGYLYVRGTILLFEDISILDEDYTVRTHQWVGITDDVIAYIADRAPEEDFGEKIDGRHLLLMPGLVNAHSHAPMTLLRGYAEGLPLQEWLNDRVFPFEARFSEERAGVATSLAIAEMLASGTTSFTDMYYFSDARAAAVLESGIKCNMCEGVIGFDGTPYRDLPVSEKNKRIVREYHHAGDDRLRVDFCIHAEYTTTPDLVRAVGEAAAAAGVGTHIHLSETALEHAQCKERHEGMTPVQYFDSLGFFEAPCTAAHGVWVEASDAPILAQRGVTIAHCPASNLKLASGVAPVYELLSAGVRVALGTDGCASNNNLDMFQDMYVAALLHKGAGKNFQNEDVLDPTRLSVTDVLKMATRAGALSQQRPDTGVIKIGMKADLIALNTDTPRMHPVFDMPGNIIYAAHGNDVRMTLVNGRVLYKDGEFKTIDIERVMHECDKSAHAMAGEVSA